LVEHGSNKNEAKPKTKIELYFQVRAQRSEFSSHRSVGKRSHPKFAVLVVGFAAPDPLRFKIFMLNVKEHKIAA
jgi:hypothetical protein